MLIVIYKNKVMDYFHLFFFLKLFRKYFAPLTISLVLSEKVICDKNQKKINATLYLKKFYRTSMNTPTHVLIILTFQKVVILLNDVPCKGLPVYH